MSFRCVFALATVLAAGFVHADTPAKLTPGDATAGEAKVTVCVACHGADGNSVIAMYPKLAGQNEAYIARQLTLFKSGKRANAIMMPFASMLSEQDMHDVGAYFANKVAVPNQADEAYVARAQKLYRGGDASIGVPACIACHGPAGRGIAGAAYPQLAGQWSDYVLAKFSDWRAGTTWGDDEHAAIMPAIAKRLNEADVAALASYAQGLHSAAPPVQK